MKNPKSMRGVSVDLGKLMSQQETNIAVGNTKSNARGDKLGRGGRVVKGASEIAREHYNKNNPRAVMQTSIKVDDAEVKKQIEEAKANPDPIVDDWDEPTPTEEAKQEIADIMQAAEAAVEEESVDEEEDEDEWVEDADGNFVKKSELENDEPVSTPKKSRSRKRK